MKDIVVEYFWKKEWVEAHSFIFVAQMIRKIPHGNVSCRGGWPVLGKVETAVTGMAEKIGEELGYEVVDLSYSKEGPDWVLRVAIDQPSGISSDDCERFSRALEKILDEVDPIPGAYLLEVTSPGLERPLKKPQDFDRFTGEMAELKLKAAFNEKRQWRGTLKGWDPEGEGGVILQVQDQTITIPWGIISRARLSPDW